MLLELISQDDYQGFGVFRLNMNNLHKGSGRYLSCYAPELVN